MEYDGTLVRPFIRRIHVTKRSIFTKHLSSEYRDTLGVAIDTFQEITSLFPAMLVYFNNDSSNSRHFNRDTSHAPATLARACALMPLAK